ncbi:unnamed protein product [Ceratitis capitata]|uniref:(Mediterranean fruit fly) hypothetical protein n=1 Tax=Ceratitis capitata TaxID=7213 RepID=A0A811UVC1_CERCA|nr:unnamed protein product [Ceratitis capitata]
MGHVNERDLKSMANGSVHGLKFNNNEKLSDCEICASEKQVRAAFPKTDEVRVSNLLEIVHSDVCGPMRHASNGGAKYFVTFIDEKSTWCEIFFIKTKSEVLNVFKEYKAKVETFTGEKIRALQTDNGREYCNEQFDTFLSEFGIKRRLTAPYTPQQNGMAERKNRTLVEMARCMMKYADAPPSFWAEAVNTACYIRNRYVTRTTGEVPYRAWTKRNPTVAYMKIFGSKAYVLNKNPSKGKFESRAEPCIFVGYSDESKAYRLYSNNKKRVIISRDVKFIYKSGFEGIFEDFANVNDKYRENEIDVVFENRKTSRTVSSSNEESLDVPAGEASAGNSRRGRGRPSYARTGQRGRPRKVYQQRVEAADSEEDADESEYFHECSEDMSANLATEDPQTLAEALKSEDSSMWLKALEDEFLAHVRNRTWQIVEKPSNRKTIGNKFVFRTKDANLKKVRLVAKGYAQRPGKIFTRFHLQ